MNCIFCVALLLLIVATHSGHCNTTSNVAKSSTRNGRIMKILKDSPGNAPPHLGYNRAHPPKPQPRRDQFPPGPQRSAQPSPPQLHYHPLHRQSGGQPTYQVLRRVQNGPPPNTQPRPQHQQLPQLLKYDQSKSSRFTYNVKENGPPPNFGKGGGYRPQFTGGPHPNALTPQGHAPQQPPNFKASAPFNGNAIVRPVSDRPQFFNAYPDIKQFPLPQQHPQHQHQHQPLQFPNDRPNSNTAPQTFPVLSTEPTKPFPTEALLQSSSNDANLAQTYSVYEDSEMNEHAPLQFNSQQNPLTYNPTHEAQPPASREADDYLKFMSTNEYFLPKFNPNYRKLDEEKDIRQHKQQQKQQLQYSKPHALTDGASAATFQQPIQVSQLFFQHDSQPGAAVVRGSYQAGNNAFVVKSDGNKAVKHIVPNSLPTQRPTPSTADADSAADTSYTQVRFNSLRHHTPEPIRFEFTERDAVLSGHTNSPPQVNHGHLRYNAPAIPNNESPIQLTLPATTPTTSVAHRHPISVNDVDADPEDGDDMDEAGTDIYGRVPIRSSSSSSTENKPAADSGSAAGSDNDQKDTEEFCERMCANVQDGDEEIICGSDGYMYTGEAQMECYASCLHIDVTIQGKGSCSAK